MKQLIEFPLEDGGTILVEVDEPEPEGGVVRAARPGEIVARANTTFEQSLDRIKPAIDVIATAIRSRLDNLSSPPDEITVMFGLKLNAAAGAFLASVGTEANYEVTLIWRRKG